MSSKFNRRKFNYFPRKKSIKFFITLIFFLSVIFFSYNNLKDRNIFIKSIQLFSLKFDYQLKFYKINNLARVESIEIIKIIQNYLDQSIFLIPLSSISDSLTSLSWVKEVKLSTDLKNTLKVKIIEFEPIGLYLFNNQIYYFSAKGVIIDKYENAYENTDFILFHGRQSLVNASKILEIIHKIKFNKPIQISNAFFINERRWNLLLSNGITILLSEIKIEDSIKNYIKIAGKLKMSEINLIQSIDLRNGEKAIIRFK